MPTNMSDFGSEISSGGENVHSGDEIFRASVHSVFILTESSFGASNKNGNSLLPRVVQTTSSEA